MLLRISLVAFTLMLLLAFTIRVYGQSDNEAIPIDDDPHGQEALRVSYLAQKSYSESVDKLIQQVKDGIAFNNRWRVMAALDGLARLKAKAAMPFLIDLLGTEFCGKIWDGEIYDALVSIGKPASLECLRQLALQGERDDAGKLSAKAAIMVDVVWGVEGDEVATFMFQRAIAKETDENHKRNLEDALKYLNSRIENEAQRERHEPEPTPAGTSDPVPTATNTGRPSGTPNATGTGTSSQGGAEAPVAQAAPFPWAIVIIAAAAALSLGAIATLLLTRRKKA